MSDEQDADDYAGVKHYIEERINQLTDKLHKNEANLNETKELEILVKTKKLVQGEATSILQTNQLDSIENNLSTEELIRLVKGDNS